MMENKLNVVSVPQIRHIDTTQSIMLDVVIALCPAAIYGCFLFGYKAAIVLLVSILSAVLAEYVWCKIAKKNVTIGDFSAVVTGLLLGMNLSPSINPLIAALGSVIAIVVVKQLFGGLGHNFANPAIAARIVLLVSFPAQMTRFLEPLNYKVVATATPLGADTMPSLFNLFFGKTSGCIGETSAFLLLIGGIYLVIRRVIKPIIPIAFIGSLFILTFITSGSFVDGLSSVLAGGVMLGAIFMATDYTTSPCTNIGKLIFGLGCGLITFVIRNFASLPEGVSYSILLMNILTPHINNLTLSKPFGSKEARKNEK